MSITILQAITTRYLPPTNRRGARVKAIAFAGSITLPWRDELNTDENHRYAAMQFCSRKEWDNSVVSGQMESGEYVHCLVPKGWALTEEKMIPMNQLAKREIKFIVVTPEDKAAAGDRFCAFCKKELKIGDRAYYRWISDECDFCNVNHLEEYEKQENAT